MSRNNIVILAITALCGLLTYLLIMPRKEKLDLVQSDLITYTPIKAEKLEELIQVDYPNQNTIENKSKFKVTIQAIGKNYTYFYNNNERLLGQVIEYKPQENKLIAKFKKEDGYVLVPNDVLIGLIKLQQAQ